MPLKYGNKGVIFDEILEDAATFALLFLLLLSLRIDLNNYLSPSLHLPAFLTIHLSQGSFKRG